MTYLRHQEPFTGTLPKVRPGDAVLCRDAHDNWQPMVAMTGPRYDHEHAYGRTVWMTVGVTTAAEVEAHGVAAAFTNWPAGDVRPSPDPSESTP